MIVRVKEHIEIPHEVSVHGKLVSFNPTATMTDEIGSAFIQSRPNIYAEVKEGETVDINLYTVKDVAKNRTFEEKFKALSGEDKLKVIAFVDSIGKKVEPVEVPLEEMKKEELIKHATEKGITIPEDITKKADILEFIQSQV